MLDTTNRSGNLNKTLVETTWEKGSLTRDLPKVHRVEQGSFYFVTVLKVERVWQRRSDDKPVTTTRRGVSVLSKDLWQGSVYV